MNPPERPVHISDTPFQTVPSQGLYPTLRCLCTANMEKLFILYLLPLCCSLYLLKLVLASIITAVYKWRFTHLTAATRRPHTSASSACPGSLNYSRNLGCLPGYPRNGRCVQVFAPTCCSPIQTGCFPMMHTRRCL